jgi:ectoine hydroxylase-related dioxygenase (phytanoyl-CoA dioxygenase family)
MVGIILMVYPFRPDNGATRFVPGSHRRPGPPAGLTGDCERQVQACGPDGSVVAYNGSVWHGHSANLSGNPRRSIQAAQATSHNQMERCRTFFADWLQGPHGAGMMAMPTDHRVER